MNGNREALGGSARDAFFDSNQACASRPLGIKRPHYTKHDPCYAAHPVRTARILLLVLLAMVLPLRSALAVAAHCEQRSNPPVTSAAHAHEHFAQHSVHEHETSASLHGDAADTADSGQLPEALSVCDMSAVSCCSMPLGSFVSGIVLPALESAVDFPSYRAHVARFLGDGPERPPRFV